MGTKVIPVSRIQQLSFRNKLAFSLSILSFFFLFPGIYFSMLTIEETGSIKAQVPHVKSGFLGIPKVEGTEQKKMGLRLLDTKRSIVNTVHDLWNKHYFFVACMITLFSIIVPIVKGLLLTYIFFTKNGEKRKNIFTFIKSIGKWSMCDVFIVAILLSYLSTGAAATENTKNVSIMGYTVHVDVLTGAQAHLHTGFWFFVSYCLISLLALQLYEHY